MDISTPPTSQLRFGPVEIEYDARVLEPRPWTLLQSEWAAALAFGAEPGPMLELCAGAGHIGLAAAVLAGRDLVQVEADEAAAGFAVRNAARAGWSARTQVRMGDLRTAVRPDERFPIVIADPPYLPSADVARWPADPPTAIDGGPDGLDLVRACLAVAASQLTPDGVVLLQVAGERQAGEVTHIVDRDPALGLRRVELRSADAERAVLLLRADAGTRPGPSPH
jgi:release factor glutamine methyltransferase